MCSNLIVLYIFIALKIICIIILPIVIILKRKEKISFILTIIDIAFLLFFLICNIFTTNKCVYNSNIQGIKRAKNENQITLYNEIHPYTGDDYSSDGITANTSYKTINNDTFYYYNQNTLDISDAYYECNDNKVYINTFGSSFTSLAMSLSTFYGREFNPVEVLDIYKEDHEDLCNIEFDIESVFSSVMERYGGITLSKIDSTQINSSLSDGGLVIVELNANENSKLTCDSNYIVIYNIALDGNYMLAIPNQEDYDYVCPSSSRAYGNVIKSDNMEKSWTLEEINSEAVNYYLIKRG